VVSKIEFLAQLPIFEGLNYDELETLAGISTEYEFEDGAVIAYQRDVANSMYIVRSGRLFAHRVDDRGIVRDSGSYFPGDYFGDVWLFAPDAHPATVKGAGKGRVIVIEGIDFLQFMEKHPYALEGLAPELDETGEVISGLSLEAWEEAQKIRFKTERKAVISLLPDELVEYQSRRSQWHLLVKIVGPTIGLVVFPVLTYALLTDLPAGAVWTGVKFVVPAILALIFGFLLAFQILDWSNDYFIITNKHLAHREFNLLNFQTSVNKIPIDQIQSVEILKPSILANVFDFGTARITTAAQMGIVFFDNIDDPRRVQAVLDRLRQRVQALDAGQTQATMRQSLESHFQIQPAYHKLENPDDEEEKVLTRTPDEAGLDAFWTELKKRYQWRVEANGVVTYRKHIFVLFREILWPAVAMVFLLLLTFVLFRLFEFNFGQLIIFFGWLFLVVAGWLIWEVEDWRNETFQITDRYVIDIDRQPFGFGESRKQAQLNNVQNISSNRPGLLPTLFNYGNVTIETAGATADITFENVPNPDIVQSDVFRRRDQYQRRQRIREGERQRKEYAVLLDVYKQALEQDRIPRRTPPDELIESAD
jgi:CRP-like cAMP-binding protein/membrane protein YdbS with pleckstrin-like domain